MFKGNVFHPAEFRAGRAKTHADACVMPAFESKRSADGDNL